MRSRKNSSALTVMAAFVALGAVLAGWPLPAAAGLTIFSSPDLPPLGKYHHVGPITFQTPGVPVVLGSILHFGFTDIVRTPMGADELETFDSKLRATVISPGPGTTILLTGPVSIKVFGKIGNTTGTFATEMLSMHLVGDFMGSPIDIQEDPNRASTGQTSIVDLGGGEFRINSFFDVFSELSLDTNIFPQQDGPSRVTLVPAPTPLLTLGAGLLIVASGMLWLRRTKGAGTW